MNKLKTLTALFMALSLSGGVAWAGVKPKLEKIGTIFGTGVETTSFGSSGVGDTGYIGLLTSGGSFRAKYSLAGEIRGLVAGTITNGVQDSHVYVKERGENDVWVQDDNYIVQWADEAGYKYEINVEGITTFDTNGLLTFFATGTFPDELIYWNTAGRFYTNNPALEYYDTKMVVIKFTEENLNFQTGEISVKGKIYALIDPVDTWETNPFADDDLSS